MTMGQDSGAVAAAKIWVTLRGLPLTIRLEWPFHQSTSGADFFVLHGDIRLEGSEGLHAPVAVNLSQTVREVLPSLEPKDAEAPVINALRKEVDRRQIEFVKSGKLLPVPFSSRHYDFKRGQWVFGKATDEAMAEFVERKVYWETKVGDSGVAQGVGAGSDSQSPLLAKDARNGAPAEHGVEAGSDSKSPPLAAKDAARNGAPHGTLNAGRVWIVDPTEAQYLQTTPGHLIEIATRLVAAQGLLRMEGEWAEATPGLMGQVERFEIARRQAVEELEKKHAFERR
jgi:hypothetical protein